MKRKWRVWATVLFLLSLAACGQTDSAPPVTASSSPISLPLQDTVYLLDRVQTGSTFEWRLFALTSDADSVPTGIPFSFRDPPHFTSNGDVLVSRVNSVTARPDRREVVVEKYDGSTGGAPRTVYRTQIDLLMEDSLTGFWWHSDLVTDGEQFYLFLERQVGQSAWHSWLDVIDLRKGAKKATVDLGKLGVYNNWLTAHPTSDGKLLLLRSLSTGKQPHFALVAFDSLMIDPAEGRLLWRKQGDGPDGLFGCQYTHWVSEDGRFLTCVLWNTLVQGNELTVQVVDIPRWEPVGRVTLPYTPPRQEETETGWVRHRFVYAEDGRYLYYVGPDEEPAVIKVDLTKPAIVGRLSLPASQARTVTTARPSLARRVLGALSRLVVSPVEAKGAVVLNEEAFLSPDGRRLYFTGGKRVKTFTDGLGQERAVKGDGIWVVDTEQMAVLGHFVPGREFFGQDTGQDTVRLSAGGERIYALDTITRNLTVLDAKTGGEIGVFTEIGKTPSSIAEVVPVRAP